MAETSTTFTARYFDGHRLQPHQTQGEISSFGLRIITVDSTVEWPKENLQVMEFWQPDRPAVIGCKQFEGARLIITDEKISQQILALVPSKNIKHGQFHHPWRILGWVCVASVLLFIGLLWIIPKASPLIADTIPHSWENSLGQYAIKAVVGSHAECVAPPGRKALAKLVNTLSTNASIQYPFDVKVIHFSKREINAFAVPGEHIIIMSGLLQFVDSPDELAGVIAHEMGHGLEHHPTQALIRQLGIRVIMNAALGSSFDFASTLLNMRHTRENEQQADDIAITILDKAHITRTGFRNFFEKLSAKETNSSLRPFTDYFSDHPGHHERMTRIQSQMPTSPLQPSLSAQEWQDLKNICQETAPLVF